MKCACESSSPKRPGGPSAVTRAVGPSAFSRPGSPMASPLRKILRAGPQAKLRVGPVDAPEEKQADRAADKVMRMPARQTQPGQAGGAQVARSGEARAEPAPVPETPSVASTQGSALPRPTLSFFESRFGRSFGNVRMHSGPEAETAAQALDARAFTVGRDVFFNRAEYQPGSVEGRRLLAHELAHVAQAGPTDTVRRTPSASSTCPANTNNSPADPLQEIGFAELMASMDAILGGMLLSSDASFLRLGIGSGSSAHRTAYEHRYGLPEQVGARFRNRFTGGTFATQNDAIAAEMESLNGRYGRISDFFDLDIRYVCSSATGSRTVGGCTDDCKPAGRFAWTCVGGPRTIVLCPHFWDLSIKERAYGLIHEAAHLVFGLLNHGSGTLRARGANPECLSSLLAEASGSATTDTRCPPI